MLNNLHTSKKYIILKLFFYFISHQIARNKKIKNEINNITLHSFKKKT